MVKLHLKDATIEVGAINAIRIEAHFRDLNETTTQEVLTFIQSLDPLI